MSLGVTMNYGDIEGIDKIYDSEGILIPKNNECILTTLDGYLEKLEQHEHLHWRIKFFDGNGIFVLTDQRLVFLREPLKYETKFKFTADRFAELADWEYWTNRSNKALAAGAKEFIELPYSEILKVENGKDFSYIHITANGEKYRLLVACEVGVELEKLQNTDGKIEPIICFDVLDSKP